MEIEFFHRPGNTAARVQLAAGESWKAEAGAMISMSPDLDVSTTTHKKSGGSFFKAAKRMLAGESFFLNHFTASGREGELWLAPSLPGDLIEVDVTETPLIASGGSFVAADGGVELDLNWQGFTSLLSGESAFWLRLTGHGKAILNAFGTIYPFEVENAAIVDTGHIVAFPETLSFSLSKAGRSWVSSFLGKEGFVCRFEGRGNIWCQSHNPNAFGKWVGPRLKPKCR